MYWRISPYMYLQCQYRLGPSFDFQLQTIQHCDFILYLCLQCPPTLIYMNANSLMGFVVILILNRAMKLIVWSYHNHRCFSIHNWMSKQVPDYTFNLKLLLWDPKRINKITSLIHMIGSSFLCIYPSTSAQESPSKFWMSYDLMVQNYIPLIQLSFWALNFHHDFENQGRLVTMILGPTQVSCHQW